MTHGGKREGAGRKADAGEIRRVRIVLTLTDDERDALCSAAAGVPLAKWIRERALDAAG